MRITGPLVYFFTLFPCGKYDEDKENMPLPKIISQYHLSHTTIAIIGLMLLYPSSLVMAADRVSDDFLAGYVASILERDLLWKRDSYILRIENGVAKITLFDGDSVRQEEANKKLLTIDGLQDVKIVVKSATIINPDKVVLCDN